MLAAWNRLMERRGIAVTASRFLQNLKNGARSHFLKFIMTLRIGDGSGAFASPPSLILINWRGGAMP